MMVDYEENDLANGGLDSNNGLDNNDLADNGLDSNSDLDSNDSEDDLLSILEDVGLEDNTPNNPDTTNTSDNSTSAGNTNNINDSSLKKAIEDDESDINDKLAQIKSLANSLSENTSVSPSGTNLGSGDLDTDLSNWYQGKDVVPSVNLNSYNANSTIKMSYGLSRHTLNSYEMMGKLGSFLNSSFATLFSPQALLALDEEEALNRVRMAFTMYKELGALNQRTYNNLIEQRNKWNQDDGDIDKLAMLLASIPSDKLHNVLEEISFKDKK